MSDKVPANLPNQPQWQAQMDAQDQNELELYTFSSNASFQQSEAQTLGGLAQDAAKAKPNV